jgi:4-hydroxy-tetrahydrodipicolinate reductase
MNVVLSGFGTMGKVLLEQIIQTDRLDVVGIVDPLHKEVLQSFQELTQHVDVLIDFSHPSRLSEILDYATQNQVAVLLATTGYSEKDIDAIKLASTKIPILYTGNTSLGINVLELITKELTKVLEGFDIEIIEAHHNQKIDAPSGTAKMLYNAVSEVRDVKRVFGRNGVSKREENDVTIHSIRGGSVVGEHSVRFLGEEEELTISHRAFSKGLFAQGAIKAALFLNKQEFGLFTMADVLRKVV